MPARHASRLLFALRLALLLALAPAALVRQDTEQEDIFRAVFPIEVSLSNDPAITLSRPVGAVAGLDTTIYAITDSSQLFLADIKTGRAKFLNPDADAAPAGGLCLDSRGPGTLYATGAQSGYVTALNRAGEVQQRYRITKGDSEGATVLLTGCIQTRYQLIIVDSINANFYFLPLSDDGPSRGQPAAIDESFEFQGFKVPMTGDWTQIGDGINGFGVEWTQNFNETGFIMNSVEGRLYAFSLNRRRVSGEMTPVHIMGTMSEFPGARGILFDSTNEQVMYISMPEDNTIAVLEFSRKDPLVAKFIRILASPLINNPVVIAEYGDWIFPLNSNTNSEGSYSLVQVPRHEQLFDDQDDPDAEFTTILDEDGEEISRPDPPRGSGDEETDTPSQPAADGSSPTTPPTNTSVADSGGEQPSETPASVFTSDNEPVEQQREEDSDKNCFPASGTVELQSGVHVRMDELQIGDSVHVGFDKNGQSLFSDVYMFSHQDRQVETAFIRIRTSAHHVLELTPGHFLYVNGKLQAASTVRVGDVIDKQLEETIRATAIEHVRMQGLYNPQTIDGSISVNGVRVSTFTTAVEPNVATALLAPIRLAHFCGSSWPRRISTLLAGGGRGVTTLLPGGSPVHI